MIPKNTIAGACNPGHMSGIIMEISSKGPEKSQLQKLASRDPRLADIRSEPGHAFVQLITTGAGEVYGANSNMDYYPEDFRTWFFPEKEGSDKSEELDGGLKKYHSTYMKYGGVYREHRNSRKGFEKQGDIALEMFNPNTHWGELVIKLPEKLWGPTLHKIATGQPVFWSQGSGVPYDICSVCSHHSKTRAEYCDCLRNHMGEMTKEGHIICALNDAPHFHDISEVRMPAEKIAFTLAKVASGHISTDDFDMPPLWLPLSLMLKLASRREADRLQVLEKLARIEKEILLQTPAQDAAKTAFTQAPEDEVAQAGKLCQMDMPQIFGELSSRRMLLTPRQFTIIVIRKAGSPLDPDLHEQLLGQVAGKLPTIFSDIASGPCQDIAEDGAYAPVTTAKDPADRAVTASLEDDLSLKPEKVRERTLRRSVKAPSKPRHQEKQASDLGAAADCIAREYAKYQISMLAAGGRIDEDELRMTVLSNKVQE